MEHPKLRHHRLQEWTETFAARLWQLQHGPGSEDRYDIAERVYESMGLLEPQEAAHMYWAVKQERA